MQRKLDVVEIPNVPVAPRGAFGTSAVAPDSSEPGLGERFLTTRTCAGDTWDDDAPHSPNAGYARGRGPNDARPLAPTSASKSTLIPMNVVRASSAARFLR